MSLQLLEVEHSTDRDTVTWSFRPGYGNNKSFTVVRCTQEHKPRFLRALESLSGGAEYQPGERVRVRVASHSGHAWELQRSRLKTSVLKDGKPVSEGSLEQRIEALHRAILDLPESPNPDTPISTGISKVRSGSLLGVGKNLRVLAAQTQREASQGILDFLGASIGSTIRSSFPEAQNAEISRLMNGLGQAKGDGNVAGEIQRLGAEAIFLRRELSDISTKVPKADAETDRRSEGNRADLMKQIETIDEIDRSIRVLQGIEHQSPKSGQGITTLKSEIATLENSGPSVELTGDISYQDTIEILCKKQALERLIRHTNATVRVKDDKIVPLIDRVLTDVREAIENEVDVTDEIETCLSRIDVKMAREVAGLMDDITIGDQSAQAGSKGNNRREGLQQVLGWVEKLGIRRSEDADESNNTDDSPESEWESMRDALEFALGKLRELSLCLGQITSDVRSSFEGLDGIQDRLVQRYRAVDKQWKASCTKFKIPKDIDLKTFVAVASKNARLTVLRHSLEAAQAVQIRRKEEFKRLGHLVKQWRTLNNSQKTDSLDNDTLVYNEGQSILRYRNERLSRFRNIDRHAVDQEATAKRIGELQQRLAKIDVQWQQSFESLGVRPPKVEAVTEQGLLEKLRTIQDLRGEYVERNTRGLNDFLRAGNKQELVVLDNPPGAADSRVRLLVLQMIEDLRGSRTVILTSEDSELRDMTQRIGCTTAEISKTAPKIPPTNRTVDSGPAEGPRSGARIAPDTAPNKRQAPATIGEKVEKVIADVGLDRTPRTRAANRATLGRTTSAEVKPPKAAPRVQTRAAEVGITPKAKAILEILNGKK